MYANLRRKNEKKAYRSSETTQTKRTFEFQSRPRVRSPYITTHSTIWTCWRHCPFPSLWRRYAPGAEPPGTKGPVHLFIRGEDGWRVEGDPSRILAENEISTISILVCVCKCWCTVDPRCIASRSDANVSMIFGFARFFRVDGFVRGLKIP